MVVCLVSLVALGDESTGPKNRDVGRYRLLRASVTTLGRGAAKDDTVFKIDSLTGRVWLFKPVIIGTNLIEEFDEIYDYSPPVDYNSNVLRRAIQTENLSRANEAQTRAWWIQWCDSHPNGGQLPNGTREGKILNNSDIIQLKRSLEAGGPLPNL